MTEPRETGVRAVREALKGVVAQAEALRLRVTLRDDPPLPAKGDATLLEMSAADIKRAEDRNCSKKHVDELAKLRERMLRHFGADTSMRKLTVNWYDTAQDYVGKRLKTKRVGLDDFVRGQTVRRELQALKRAFKIAKRRNVIKTVPPEWPEVKGSPADKR